MWLTTINENSVIHHISVWITTMGGNIYLLGRSHLFFWWEIINFLDRLYLLGGLCTLCQLPGFWNPLLLIIKLPCTSTSFTPPSKEDGWVEASRWEAWTGSPPLPRLQPSCVCLGTRGIHRWPFMIFNIKWKFIFNFLKNNISNWCYRSDLLCSLEFCRQHVANSFVWKLSLSSDDSDFLSGAQWSPLRQRGMQDLVLFDRKTHWTMIWCSFSKYSFLEAAENYWSGYRFIG